MNLPYSIHTPAVRPPLVLPSGPAWQPARTWLDTPMVKAVIRQAELMRPRIPEHVTVRTRAARRWSIRRSIVDRPHILPNRHDLKVTWHWLRGAQ